MNQDPRLLAFLEQLDNILLVLERPVVQRQLVAIGLTILLAWLLALLLGRILERFEVDEADPRSVGQPAWRHYLARWPVALDFLLFPILGILVGQTTVILFQVNLWPAGLLNQGIQLVWLLVGYRLLVATLYAALEDESAAIYHRRFLTPLAVVVAIYVFSRTLAGTFSVGDIELGSLWGAQITPGKFFDAGVVLYFFLVISWGVQELLGKVVLPKTSADAGVSNTITTITRYALVTIGLLMTISTLGFSLSALTIIGGGLSVGIGFGMQDLVANFISGILLMFDQTLRPGDVIEIGGQRGRVESLRIRSTVIRTANNVELFVPNKTLLTSTVSAITHTDRVVRREVPVGVSYQSDPQQIRDVLLEVGRQHPMVLSEPNPKVMFVEFGPSSLDFQLWVWVDVENSLTVTSELRFQIWEAFAAHDIEIPFPQQDIHVRSGLPTNLTPSNFTQEEP